MKKAKSIRLWAIVLCLVQALLLILAIIPLGLIITKTFLEFLSLGVSAVCLTMTILNKSQEKYWLLAVIGVSCLTASCLFDCIPLMGIPSWIFGFVGLILAIVAIIQYKALLTDDTEKKIAKKLFGMVIIVLVTYLLGIIPVVGWIVKFICGIVLLVFAVITLLKLLSSQTVEQIEG